MEIIKDPIFLSSSAPVATQGDAIHPAFDMSAKSQAGGGTDTNSAKSQSSDTSMQSAFVVTIDGPAASGKSSVSRELARRLDWAWVSTGAFYRGLAYVASQSSVDLTNEQDVVDLAMGDLWSIRLTREETHVMFKGQDVTSEINREDVGTLASKISSFPLVRKALLAAQRQCAVGVRGLVAEGRDCGTVVFPTADLKFFLTARAEDRAARRAKDEGRDLDQTINDQKIRDEQDATRKAAPMQASAEANVIDTTTLGFEEVVAQVEMLVRATLKFESDS